MPMTNDPNPKRPPASHGENETAAAQPFTLPEDDGDRASTIPAPRIPAPSLPNEDLPAKKPS